MFLAQLWNLTREEVYRDACFATVRPIQMILKELVHPDQINLGAFLGLGGIAYGFAQLSSVLDDSAMKQSAHRLLKEIPRLLPQDQLYDLIGGSAGALAVIASMLEQNQEDAWLIDIGEQLVKHLIQHATPMETGVAWKPGNSPKARILAFLMEMPVLSLLYAVLCLGPNNGQLFIRLFRLRLTMKTALI